MKKKKVLVVEDEIIIADNLCDTLEELGYDVTEPAINYTEAFIIIEDEKPDIAILDVQLSGKKTGIDVARRIRSDYDFPFIFLTSNTDTSTINEAKDVRPSAFLVKPFSKEELYASLEIALSNYSKKKDDALKAENKFLFVKSKGVYVKVYLNDILYLKSDHVYVKFVIKSKEDILVRVSLNDVSTSLSSSFLRVHRGYIVNLRHILEVSNNSITINNEEIPIGNKYKETVMKYLKN